MNDTNKERLIYANKLMGRLTGWKLDCLEHSDFETASVIDDCMCELDAQPTVEAVEVVHGRWLGTHDGWYYSYSCSECGAEALTKEETMHDQVCSAYCPNCGAKMDGDENV